MSDSPDKQDLVIDEDWKSRVQAEKAAAQAAAPPASPAAEPKPAEPAAQPRQAKRATEQPIPPPSIMLLISTLATQSLMALAPEPTKEDPSPAPRLGEARHLIDMLAVL